MVHEVKIQKDNDLNLDEHDGLFDKFGNNILLYTDEEREASKSRERESKHSFKSKRKTSNKPYSTANSRGSSKTSNKTSRYPEYKIENPYKVSYWTKVETKVIDDGSDQSEVANMLRRKVSELRNHISKMTVAYNDLKRQSRKEIDRLRSILDMEKNRRIQI